MLVQLKNNNNNTRNDNNTADIAFVINDRILRYYHLLHI